MDDDFIPDDFPEHYPLGCESPIEEFFKWEIDKLLAPDAKLKLQEPCATKSGNYRVDFVVEHEKRRIGLECDGKEFHDYVKDYDRDRAIIEAGCLNVIYRFRGSDIYHHIYEALKVVLGFEPQIFAHGAAAIIKTRCDRTGKYEYVDFGDRIYKYIEPFRDHPEDDTPVHRVEVLYRGKPSQPFHIEDEFFLEQDRRREP